MYGNAEASLMVRSELPVRDDRLHLQRELYGTWKARQAALVQGEEQVKTPRTSDAKSPEKCKASRDLRQQDQGTTKHVERAPDHELNGRFHKAVRVGAELGLL